MQHHPEPYTGHIHASPQVNLPNPAVQSYIHELAKTLPGPRKQNSACDACRSRKVKCNRVDGEDKCQHCLSKNYPCTHYVQHATAEKRKTTGVQRRQRGLSAATPYPLPQHNAAPVAGPELSPPPSGSGSALSASSSYSPAATGSIDASPVHMGMSMSVLVLHMFAPPPPLAGHSAAFSRADLYAAWGEEAGKLDDPLYRAHVTEDLVEVFFQIVHSRWPMLHPADFRARLDLAGDGDGSPGPALHPAIVATVLAWGAKFSEHILFRADRARNGGQGLLAKAVIDRARAVAEVLRVPRVATPENVIACLLLEPVQPLTENPDDPSGFQGYWLSSAVKHLITLQYNRHSVVVNIPDGGTRQIMIFCWWMACLCDAYSSAYYRRKPDLDDDDYNVEFYTVESIDEGQEASTPQQLEMIGYYTANHALARIARGISKQLWKPAVEEDGVPLAALAPLFTQLRAWKAAYLHQVGVPADSTAGWDFLAAISACASDATYHVLWVIVFNALDDFGVREENEASAPLLPGGDVDQAKQELFEEALHGALRIAGLAGVLASNGYLRLDTAVMHVSCIQAGMLLARLARPEVTNCIAALQQYSYAYEEAAEQGREIERAYAAARAGARDLGRMADVAFRGRRAGSAG